MSRFHIVWLIGLILAVVALRVGTMEPSLNRKSFVDATAWTGARFWRSGDDRAGQRARTGAGSATQPAGDVEVPNKIRFTNEFGVWQEVQIRNPIKFDDGVRFQNVNLPVPLPDLPHIPVEQWGTPSQAARGANQPSSRDRRKGANPGMANGIGGTAKTRRADRPERKVIDSSTEEADVAMNEADTVHPLVPSTGTVVALQVADLDDVAEVSEMPGQADAASEDGAGAELAVDAGGADIRRLPTPTPVRGLFLTGWAAGERLDETIEYMREHDLNTLVVDIKDTDGLLSFALPGTTAQRLGANARKMGSPERVRQTLRDLKEQGIYVIGRLVLFQDNFLPLRRPQWALRTVDGGLWRDASGGYWLDPTRPEVLDYHVEIAVAAAAVGFDEIQFDYIRYPGQRVPGYNDGPAQQRIGTITRFAKAARERIAQQTDIPVSAAIYGIVAVNEADHHLGQDLNELTATLDYISPMFYPSHYLSGDFGLSDPNAEPYRTLFASTAAALARTSEADWARLRPWIQSFFGYNEEQVEDQIRAMKDLGVDSFLVWNPIGRYVAGVDYHLTDEDESRLATSPFRQIIYPLMSPATGVFRVDPAFKFPAHQLPGAPHNPSGAWHVQATRNAGGYRLELWQAPATDADPPSPSVARAEHAEDTGPSTFSSRRVVAIQRSLARSYGLPSRGKKTFGREEDGITLTWVEQGFEWYLWAPSFGEVLAAKQSLETLPASLF